MSYSCLEILDSCYVRLRNTVTLGENGVSFSAISYGNNIVVCQSSIPVIKSIVMSSLDSCIFIVVIFRAHAKMLWIHTRRIVACMHDNLSFWNFTDEFFITKPMRSHGTLTRQQQYAIAVIVSRAIPNPTPRWMHVISGCKNIMRTEDWKFRQSFCSPYFFIMTATQFATNGFRLAKNALHGSTRLITHGISSKLSETRLYAISMEVAS